MTDDLYKTIETISEGLYKEKGSKFISYAYPVSSDDEIKSILANLKKQYYDARHQCFAFMLGHAKDRYRTVDDGEPSSTAGKPILGQILSNDITNVLIVVIRYFGGTKLGVGGLINAYRSAAASAIENNHIIEKTIDVYFVINFDYLKLNNVMKLVKDYNLNIMHQDFGNLCSMELSVRQTKFEKIKSLIIKIGEIDLQLLKEE